MSYVVHLFQHPGPATLDEAVAVHEQLSGTQAAPNPLFAQLAQALIKRFPSEVGGLPPLEDLWLEEVPDGLTGGSAVYSLGVYGAGLTHLMPAMVSEALRLGLCVLDEQAGRCYVPDAWVLTHTGRQRLKLKPPASTPVAAGVAPDPLTMAWTRQRLLAVLGPAMAEAGFVGRIRTRPSGVTFIRSTAGGLQDVQLDVSDRYHIGVTVYGGLEPEIPHALSRAASEYHIMCQPHHHRALLPFQGAGPSIGTRGPFDVIQTTVQDGAQLEALALALGECLRDEYLPLLDACADLPGIVRAERMADTLTGRLRASRVLPALVHWAGLGDVRDYAEDLIQRRLPNTPQTAGMAILMRRTAQRLHALDSLRGTWSPPTRWRAVPTPDDVLMHPALNDLLLPRIRAVAERCGFVMHEPEPRIHRFERIDPDVHQWFDLRLEPDSDGKAGGNFVFGLSTPSLHLRWKALLAPFGSGRTPRGGTWSEGNLFPATLDVFDIDRWDFRLGRIRPDRLEEHLAGTETALALLIERAFDPARTLAGVASQLQAQNPDLFKKGDAKSGDFERWACWLLLAGEFRPDLVEDYVFLARRYFDVPRGMYGTYYKEEHTAMLALADEALRLAAAGGA